MSIMLDLNQYTNNKFLFFDGAFGTMLQKYGLVGLGELPPVLNLTRPDEITKIHDLYAEAGSDIVTTNTFEANRFKLENTDYSVEEVVKAAVKNARKSKAPYVALDIGPTGKLLEPIGETSFEEANQAFAEIVEAGKEADLIILETFSDLLELKAALLAAKEHSDLPVIASMTFTEDGRTFTGTDPVTATLTLQALGADAVGVNCSLGPEELKPVVNEILSVATVPVIVQANAGLPEIEDGETVYRIGPEIFAETITEMTDNGVSIIGGCCGTSPEYIQEIKKHLENKKPNKPENSTRSALTSPLKTVFLDEGITTVGERINPTGRNKLKEALRTHQLDPFFSEGLAQEKEGADILDINVGLPEIDEEELLKEIVLRMTALSTLPVQIDSSNPKALEAALRVYPGIPSVNSVNGTEESLATVLPLVKKYGAHVIGLTLDEDGIPKNVEGRLKIAKRIIERAESLGISKDRIIIDALTLTASAQPEQAGVTLETIRRLNEELGVKTTLGVSNISFGLPERDVFNAAFLGMALNSGLTTPIINPGSEKIQDMISVYNVINGQDKKSAEYIKRFSERNEDVTEEKDSDKSLTDHIIEGAGEAAAAETKKLLKKMAPNDIVNNFFVPALNRVGNDFESGDLFLPQLMQSASAVQRAFQTIQESIPAEDIESKGKVLLATVKGDIHDIGKNIVKLMLENYGYTVYDMGSDVDPEKIIEAIEKEDIKLVGLSALMTTTVESMKETIEMIREKGYEAEIMVGGAVLTEDYAGHIGADHYAKDAQTSIKIANAFFKNQGVKDD